MQLRRAKPRLTGRHTRQLVHVTRAAGGGGMCDAPACGRRSGIIRGGLYASPPPCLGPGGLARRGACIALGGRGLSGRLPVTHACTARQLSPIDAETLWTAAASRLATIWLWRFGGRGAGTCATAWPPCCPLHYACVSGLCCKNMHVLNMGLHSELEPQRQGCVAIGVSSK